MSTRGGTRRFGAGQERCAVCDGSVTEGMRVCFLTLLVILFGLKTFHYVQNRNCWSQELNEEDGIDASVVFGMIRDLSILAPDHFAGLGDESQFTDVHLNDGSLRDDSQAGVHGGVGILLDSDDGQLEGGLQLRVRDVCLIEPQSHGSNESLKLGRLACESFPHERHLCHHPLPAFLILLARLQDTEHLCIRLCSHFGDRDVPLAGLFLPLLLDHVGEDFSLALALTIQQVGWHSSVVHLVLCLLLALLLLVHADRFLHLHLLIESLLVVDLGLQSSQSLRFGGDTANLTGCLLPLTILMIQTATESLLSELDVLVLRHDAQPLTSCRE